MRIIAIMGSPRRGGNTELLLDEFIRGVEEEGGEVEKLAVCGLSISPCIECLCCEKTGKCAIKDDMQGVYGALLSCDKIVVASPIFFYGLPAQLKALIDRCQALWSGKLIAGSLSPPSGSEKNHREGFAILLGATGGKELFTGSLLTIRYFLDTFDGRLSGRLLFRNIDKKGEISLHPTALAESYRAGLEFIQNSSSG